MDFDACFALLAARPAHAHHCEPDADAHLDSESASADAQSTQDGAFAELRAPALVTAFFRLQEARAGVYKSFHACVTLADASIFLAPTSNWVAMWMAGGSRSTSGLRASRSSVSH